ncbi:polysaccharide biosynthesis tyrosine autokinase [Paraburkholderia caffeinilytica]|uniref:Tyrosine-protein kinase involved in EPS biosynthesis n=1 Tax=Paraburkholderia caffeinilytica TaxID=1761016 RepID=A0ABQ1N8F1_9BURK|nr:polysaccharide biosynthesis tyrosine autokinase [Paraburkholderia caffeinilytica]GGC59750.1 tyrosine-protein kinase involved in EPS biosynthesis [Paraburkholderia caffeinilytica]CAB3807530.1 Putative tyrosine-protein kinase in cps region [Paraburkholderia caffeinilytica]
MAINFENRYTDVSAQDELHLSDYLRTIVRGWRTIVMVTLIALALGCAYAFLAPPTYRADVLFHVEDKTANANANGKDSLPPLTGMFDTKPSTAAEIELLKSRLVTEETVKKLHLDITASPRYLPFIGGMIAGLVNGQWGLRLPPFINLSGYAWGNESIAVSRFDTSKDFYDTTFTLIAGDAGSYVLRDKNGIAILSGHVGETVETDTADGPIALHVDKLVGAPGSRFELQRASTLGTVDRLQKALVVAETTLQSGVIRTSLEGGDPALTAAIVNSMAREFVRQDVESRSTEAEHMLAFLDQQLPGLRKELDEAEQRYNKFRNAHGTVDLGEESRLLLQQVVDNKTKLLDLQQQRAEMSQRFTANHPAVAALDAQIAALQGAAATMNRSVAVMPDTEQTALRLLRDVHVDTELYTNLLNSAQQLRVAKAGQVGNVRVVDFAETPDEPVRPKRVLAILISLGGGLLIGIMLTFFKRAMYGGVERPDELEAVLGVPVFAIVPRSQTQLRLQENVMLRRRGLHVLAQQAPEDIAVEGVRNLRTSLQLSLDHAENNIVMITGSRPDTGKSFLSVNLAALVASANKRVLIIDGDMRRGDVHSHFGIAHQPGLSDVLSGGDLASMVQRDVLPGLDVLAKGTLPSHPSELLMSKRFQTMLDDLKSHYDIVIVDTPPVLAVTDSTVIGKYAGTTLLVVRHGRHPLNEIAETAKRLLNGGVSLKGVLLTDVPQEGAFLGSGYQGGYYGYDSIAG